MIDIVATDLIDLFKQADGRTVDLNGVKKTLDLKGVRVARMEMAFAVDNFYECIDGLKRVVHRRAGAISRAE